MEQNNEDALAFFNRLLARLHQADETHHGSTNIQFVYVASGGQHIDTQNIYYDRQKQPTQKAIAEGSKEPHVIPPPEVMVEAIESTIRDGLWATSTCWSVVYVVYRMLGYEGGISDFVREVETWSFSKPLKFKCNRDSVGKPLRDRRMTYNLNQWLGNGIQKQYYLLAVALQEEIKKRFP